MGEVLRLKAEQLQEMLRRREDLDSFSQISSPEPSGNGDLMIERAREILGKDFLGVEAVRNMEQKLNTIGVEVKFVLDKLPPFPYTEDDLQIAKENQEMLVLRVSQMIKNGVSRLITLAELQEVFQEDPLEKRNSVFYFRGDWYRGKVFTIDPREITWGWALVKKDVLSHSNVGWDNQNMLIQELQRTLERMGAKNFYVRRRTALETVYDLLLYYVNTGERLLPDRYDCVRNRSDGSFLYVGYFDKSSFPPFSGIRIDDGSSEHPLRAPDSSGSIISVCPTR